MESFIVQFAIHTVISVLTIFVKNPNSAASATIRLYLGDLKDAVDTAVAAFPPAAK